MNVQKMKVLMEINSLQSLGAVQSYTKQQPTSPLFTSMLGEMINQSTSSSLNTKSTVSTNPLTYTGMNHVFYPSTLSNLLTTSTQAPTSTIKNNTHDSKGYAHIIKKAADTFKLPERLISSVIQHESNFNSQAVSAAGAQGLMQLMPGTARFLGVKDSFNPEQNITGGAKYLRQMLDQFNGNIELALAAYNAGPGNVKKYGGIPPFKETQGYVKKVLNTFYK
ncbi:lytic transglycosylase domain-containing protein [Sporosarcina ureilytica]|uniref:Transglycosylase SLT domain-containing protein n=1 Tax=Sporosarcina ureilytica TaxID=298596 RepID=A0A1D8JIB2_9BACL|nr:lytic transglycosylase domain-containing protein [Sporosarcina ureilytica]AOV08448.1 hypothetical protein BI350_13495 [Sporosarcina ureilytica]